MLKELVGDILSWKQIYKVVFYVKIVNNLYIFRTLTRGEYFNLLSLQKNDLVETSEFLLKMCLLYPKYDKDVIDNTLAGEIDYLVNNITKLSGFSDGDKLLKDIEEERNNIGMLDNQIVLTICKAFPQLTPDNIDNLNYHQLMHYLAMAEDILDVKLNIEKPEDQTKINFDKDNRALNGGPKQLPVNKRKPTRGDVSK